MSDFPPPSGVILENPPCPANPFPMIGDIVVSFKDMAYKKTLYVLNGLGEEAQAIIDTFDEIFGGLWPLSANDPLFGSLDSFDIKIEQKMKAIMNEMQIFFIVKLAEIINLLIPFDILAIPLPWPLDDFTVGDLFDETKRGEMKQELSDLIDLDFDLPSPLDKMFKPPFGPIMKDVKVVEWFTSLMTQTANTLLQPIFDIMGTLISTFEDIWDALGLDDPPTLQDIWTSISNTIDGIFDTLGDNIEAIYTAIGEITIPILNVKIKDIDTVPDRAVGLLIRTADLARRLAVAFMAAIFAPFKELLDWIAYAAEFFSDLPGWPGWPAPLNSETGQLTFCEFLQFVLPGFPPDISSL